MANLFWSKRNEKLQKTEQEWLSRYKKRARIRSFNIPQLKSESGVVTCPYAGACAGPCYAGQGRFNMDSAKQVREINLDAILNSSPGEFVRMALEDLRSMRGLTHMRVHDSGDFFRKSYYKSWIKIAQGIPEITFYAYTKSIPFLSWDDHPKNFRVTQSLGGKRDHQVSFDQPVARIFESERARRGAGYCDGGKSDIPAIIGAKKIGLVYHGSRSMRPSELVQISSVRKYEADLKS